MHAAIAASNPAAAASREVANYYRLRSAALKAESQVKGIVLPDITDSNNLDDPFLSGALGRLLVDNGSDRDIYIFFAHLSVRLGGLPFGIINLAFVF
jgi:hypothetical protein